uniref:Uncharacterized protein n=1 Tax=Glossina austeni TaxID=7395 RepID=A0A1A9UGE4_GLOAU
MFTSSCNFSEVFSLLLCENLRAFISILTESDNEILQSFPHFSQHHKNILYINTFYILFGLIICFQPKIGKTRGLKKECDTRNLDQAGVTTNHYPRSPFTNPHAYNGYVQQSQIY